MRLLQSLSLGLNVVFLGLVSCGSAPQMPKWDGKIWAGDHKNQRVVRTQENPPAEILTSDPQFSDGVWMSYPDLSCLYQQLVFNCKEWKQAEPECKPVSNKKIRKFVKQSGY